MDDAMAGGHQVHGAGFDPELRAERVAMFDRAVEQIGDGREVDVRVRAHVDAATRGELCRAHLVEEQERPHHRAGAAGQRAVDLEPAQVVGDGGDGLEDEIVKHGQAPFREEAVRDQQGR